VGMGTAAPGRLPTLPILGLRPAAAGIEGTYSRRPQRVVLTTPVVGRRRTEWWAGKKSQLHLGPDMALYGSAQLEEATA